MRPYLDLFFMGAAFLLLETMNVVRFALWFGTTWFVNALVFFGILVAVLLAVEIARRVRLPGTAFLYALLAISLGVAWLVPPSALLALAGPSRLLAATALAFLPVFLANLIFAARFRDTARSTVAFGANLLGAMLGGVLEYGALVIGYRNLLFAVAVLYGVAFALRPRDAGAQRTDGSAGRARHGGVARMRRRPALRAGLRRAERGVPHRHWWQIESFTTIGCHAVPFGVASRLTVDGPPAPASPTGHVGAAGARCTLVPGSVVAISDTVNRTARINAKTHAAVRSTLTFDAWIVPSSLVLMTPLLRSLPLLAATGAP